MKTAQIEVHYEAHHGSDLMVVNAARQSFNKQKSAFEDKDKGLIAFLASGMRTQEWDAFLDEILTFGGQAFLEPDHVVAGVKERLKKRLIQYKRQAQHWAPFGHPHVTLRLRMPIFLARQFVKHQVGGVWSEESRRYIDDEPEFYFEPVLMGRPDDVKQGAAGALSFLQNAQAMTDLVEATSFSATTYQRLVDDIKVAPEQAREILTLNTMTGVTWTGSLLFWSRVCNQRLDAHAQSAAQTLAKHIADIVEPLYPVSWHHLVGDGV